MSHDRAVRHGSSTNGHNCRASLERRSTTFAPLGMTRQLSVAKDCFDGRLKKAGNLIRERETWIVFLDFERIDCLTTYAETLSKIGLGPFALGAQYAQAVLHR
jgi:hypothetical protein